MTAKAVAHHDESANPRAAGRPLPFTSSAP
jgi:hypothetical protein